MTTVLVVAPHPDDETLGCGGTMLRHRDDGDAVHWLLATAMTAPAYTTSEIADRQRVIAAVATDLGVAGVHELGFPTATLDTVPRGDLVAGIASVCSQIEPEIVYIPHRGDVHTDHGIVAHAASAATKWFRCPSVVQLLAYETPSETDAAAPADAFVPRHFVDISAHLAGKLGVLEHYGAELGEFPFPRSADYVEALARSRGAAAGFDAAEAFDVVRWRR